MKTVTTVIFTQGFSKLKNVTTEIRKVKTVTNKGVELSSYLERVLKVGDAVRDRRILSNEERKLFNNIPFEYEPYTRAEILQIMEAENENHSNS